MNLNIHLSNIWIRLTCIWYLDEHTHTPDTYIYIPCKRKLTETWHWVICFFECAVFALEFWNLCRFWSLTCTKYANSIYKIASDVLRSTSWCSFPLLKINHCTWYLLWVFWYAECRTFERFRFEIWINERVLFLLFRWFFLIRSLFVMSLETYIYVRLLLMLPKNECAWFGCFLATDQMCDVALSGSVQPGKTL